jgi:hypothetical protein
LVVPGIVCKKIIRQENAFSRDSFQTASAAPTARSAVIADAIAEFNILACHRARIEAPGG